MDKNYLNINIGGMTSASFNEVGLQFGYTKEFLHKSCKDVREILSQSWSDYHQVPNQLKIMTYNIWGFEKKFKGDDGSLLRETMEIRMKEVIKVIKENDPDIVLLQEMSAMSFSLLKDLFDIYPYCYEENFLENLTKLKRNHIAEVFILSRFKPKFIKLYSCGGNLSYDSPFMIIGFDNLIVINCHCQAGSKYSPGQENVAHHYSRCRLEQYTSIHNKLSEFNKNEIPVIIAGDFNADLNGSLNDWPELKLFEEKGYEDANKGNNEGFTEDTNINSMRFNIKFMEKQLRYDGFLTKNLKISNMKIVGTNPISISKDLSDKIKQIWIPKIDGWENKIKYNNLGLIDLFPSDHFGVVAEILLESLSK